MAHSFKQFWTMKIMSATISFRRLRRTLIIWDQDANKDSRNIYWRRASIQDGQASRSTYDATFRNLFFCDNVVIFRRRSKRIAFLESVNFSTRDLMQIVNFRDGHVTTFRHPSRAYICQMPGHRLSRLARGTPSESRLSIDTICLG